MKNCCMILTREHQKLSSSEFHKYEYLAGEEILPSNRNQIIDQAKFTYSPLGKALEKQTNKQTAGLKFLNLSDKTNE